MQIKENNSIFATNTFKIMYWLSNLMCDLIFSIYNPSYYHLFLKEQECYVTIFLKQKWYKTHILQTRLSILFRESLFYDILLYLSIALPR